MYKISVLIATYNMRKFIVEAIDSCLNNLEGCEVVVVDDGSTDGTYLYIKELYKNSENVRIDKFDENRGKVSAFNRAFELSTGVLVTLLGADDCVTQGRNIAANIMLKNPSLSLVVGNYVITDQDLNVRTRCKVKPKKWPFTLIANPYPGGAMLLTRKFGEEIFPLGLDLNNEDYLISLVASYKHNVLVVDECVLMYRRHNFNTWSNAKYSNIFVMASERKRKTLLYFMSKYKPFSDNEFRSISLAVKVCDNIRNYSFLKAVRLIPELVNAKYPVSVIIRVAVGPKLSGWLKSCLVKTSLITR